MLRDTEKAFMIGYIEALRDNSLILTDSSYQDLKASFVHQLSLKAEDKLTDNDLSRHFRRPNHYTVIKNPSHL